MATDLVTSREVEGVAYTTLDMAPGLSFFACQPLAATVSITGCEKRWREAQAPVRRRPQGGGPRPRDEVEDTRNRLLACRGCAVGAHHAGERHISYSSLFNAPICPRCRTGNTRMIGNRICVSCYNREREIASGRNARGNAPTKLRLLRPARFRAVVDGSPSIIFAPAVVDTLEPMVQALRTTRGKVTFAFAPPPVLGRGQTRLFDEYSPRPAPPAVRRAAALRRARAWSDDMQGSLF